MPLRNRLGIESLPPDIISEFLTYLDACNVDRLYASGSRELAQKLTASDSVKKLRFVLERVASPRWPKTLLRYPHAREVEITMKEHYRHVDIPEADFTMIPKGVEKLSLCFGNACTAIPVLLELELNELRSVELVVCSRNQNDAQDGNEILPHAFPPKLQTLRFIPLGEIMRYKFANTNKLPETLTELAHPRIVVDSVLCPDTIFPSRLQVLSNFWVEGPAIVPPMSNIRLPAEMTTLGLVVPSLYNFDLSHLPKSLTSLELSSYAEHFPIACNFDWMPKTLTRLNFGCSTYELTGPLPPSITDLQWFSASPSSSIVFLPPLLKHLTFAVAADMDPQHLSLLPQTLITLILYVSGQADLICDPNPFPKSLQSLSIHARGLEIPTPKIAQGAKARAQTRSVPPFVTLDIFELPLSWLTTGAFSKLTQLDWRGVQEPNSLSTAALVKLLPRSLTSLCHRGPFIHETGTSYEWPPNLDVLECYNISNLGDDLVEKTPRTLRSLTLFGDWYNRSALDGTCLGLLPRSLTEFHSEFIHNITSQDLLSLPLLADLAIQCEPLPLTMLSFLPSSLGKLSLNLLDADLELDTLGSILPNLHEWSHATQTDAEAGTWA